LEYCGAAERLVLAYLRDIVGQLLLDGPALRILGGAEHLHICAVLKRQRRDVPDEVLELLVLGDEVRLRVDLDNRAALALNGNSDEAFRSGAPSLFGGSRKTLGAEPVDRGSHVAVGLADRL